MNAENKSKSRTDRSQKTIATIPDLIKELGISQWDAMIIGDGSARKGERETGWAAILLDRYSEAEKLFYGAVNCGTVAMSELLPYFYAMAWYCAAKGPGTMRRWQAQEAGRNLHIHAVTDSQITAEAGNNPTSRHSMRELWASFDAWKAAGFELTFHHVPRSVIPANVFVDAVSRQAVHDLNAAERRALVRLRNGYPRLSANVSFRDFCVWSDESDRMRSVAATMKRVAG